MHVSRVCSGTEHWKQQFNYKSTYLYFFSLIKNALAETKTENFLEFILQHWTKTIPLIAELPRISANKLQVKRVITYTPKQTKYFTTLTNFCSTAYLSHVVISQI